MITIFPEFDNVFYESPIYLFDKLNESSFLKDIFKNLYSLMKDNFYNYIFFIFSFNYKLNYLPESALLKTQKKKILIYISDESGNIPYYLSSYYLIIFKIHLQIDKFLVNNIFNFPLGCAKNVPQLPIIQINNRKYNVFFSGNLNKERIPFFLLLLFNFIPHRVIYKLLSYLIKIVLVKKLLTKIKFDNKFNSSYIRFTDGFQKGLSPKMYGEIIANSKIVLCPKGFKFTESFRLYEAMRQGCIIISEKLPQTYFYYDSPIIQVSDWKEGLKKANELMGNNTELKKLSKTIYDWWENHCSANATASYIINCIKNIEENDV
jgi:hypothetical protein